MKRLTTREYFLSHAEAARTAEGVSDRAFSLSASSDHKFLKKVRDGKNVTLEGIEKIESHIEDLIDKGIYKPAESRPANMYEFKTGVYRLLTNKPQFSDGHISGDDHHLSGYSEWLDLDAPEWAQRAGSNVLTLPPIPPAYFETLYRVGNEYVLRREDSEPFQLPHEPKRTKAPWGGFDLGRAKMFPTLKVEPPK